jgi:hypothetical protein
MTITVLATIPCRVCGHRVSGDAIQCEYCGCAPARKRKPPVRADVARAVGRCAMCGGRLARRRGVVDRLLVRVGLRDHRTQRLTCSSCGHLEPAR